MASMLTFILADFMQLMRQHVPPHDIVRRIIANSHHSNTANNSFVTTAQDGNLGEFKDVITSMVITDIQDTILYATVKGTCNVDVSSLLQVKGKLIRKAKRFEELSTTKLTQLEHQYQSASDHNGLENATDDDESSNPIQQAISRQLPNRPSRAVPNTPTTANSSTAVGETERMIVYTSHELELLGRKRIFQLYKVS